MRNCGNLTQEPLHLVEGNGLHGITYGGVRGLMTFDAKSIGSRGNGCSRHGQNQLAASRGVAGVDQNG